MKNVIENHDAWTNNDATADEVTIALQRATAARVHTPEAQKRIGQQKRALASLVTSVPSRLSSAG